MTKNVLCVVGLVCPQNAFVEGRIFNGGLNNSRFEGGRKGAHPQKRGGWWDRLPSDAYCANNGPRTKVLMKKKM